MVSEGQGSSQTYRGDPGWKYCHLLEDADFVTLVCNFCRIITEGGIIGVKLHLVSVCTKCPDEVREEIQEYENDKKKQKSIGDSNLMDLDPENPEYDDSEEEHDNDADFMTPGSATRRMIVDKKGPRDLFCRKPGIAVGKRKRERLGQASIREARDKEAKARVHQCIARFFYQAGLPLNLINSKSFQDMLMAIGSHGPNLLAPSCHELRIPLLKKELEYTENLFKDHKKQGDKHGCSIMLDAWTDGKQRCLINILVSSSAGTKFVKSIDGSKYVKTGEKLFELLDSLVDKIGEEKVVQVITKNGSNYDVAGKMLEDKRPHLFWTPCAAHCIDLILEDIGKLPMIKKTIRRGISLVGFIYSHSSTLNLLRHFTNKRELVRHGVTRFATSFLSLERLHQEKANLRRMFISEKWTKNKLSKGVKGKQAEKVVLTLSFWDHVIFTLKVMAPLVRVFRLVDGERKPAMGYIYEAMDKAKEAIMKSFNNNESKYKDVFAIIDDRWACQLRRALHAAGHFLNPEFFYDKPQLEFDLKVTIGLYDCIKRLVPSRDVQEKILCELPIYKEAAGLFGSNFAKLQRKTIAPDQWWRMYGHSAPNLQQLAIKILSLTCSASRYGCNWSVFEQIHSKKRNRRDHKKLQDLVYVKYNQALKERYILRDEIDPITLNDIDEFNEWLVGDMDDDNDDADDNELVFDDDNTLNRATVYKASGVGEPRTYTRQKIRKRKEPSSGAMAAKTFQKGPVATSTSKGKEKVVEDEDEDEDESEFEDNYQESEEEELNFEESEGEEEEGYASLDYEENDYVRIEEED